jgi:hypothetical protein
MAIYWDTDKLIKTRVKVTLSLYHHVGAQGEMSYSFYSFLTSAVNRGEWSASRPGRTLPLGKDLRYPLDRRLGGPQLVWTQRLEEKSLFFSAGD